MSMPERKFHGGRAFLNKPGYHGMANVIAEVEDTQTEAFENQTYNYGPLTTLIIADCDRKVTIEFDLSTVDERDNSLHKVDTLVNTLKDFQRGMKLEARRAAAREKAKER